MRENQVYKCLWIIKGRTQGDPEYGRHAFQNTHGRFANVDDNIAAIQMYANESRILSCLTDRGEVRLIKRADGMLERLAIDNDSGQIGAALISTTGPSSEEAVGVLSQCDATVNGGSVVFSRLRLCEEWPDPIRLEFWTGGL